jgi:outer membrane receptor protein involved in Fe transport
MTKRISGLCLCAAGAALMLIGSAADALAQDTSSGGIEEVVVTATRRAEDINKVALSVSAFTPDKLDKLNVKSFADLVKFTPGVAFDSHSSNISIRGVNSTAGDATTGIYIDDTPIQLRTLGFGSDNTLPAVFDLERVEVLRGPQGTLFGAGSEGGTVRYITPQPSLTDYSVYGKTEVSTTEGGDPSYEAGVAVGGPIVDDKLGFRISGWWRHDGGYIDQVNYLTGASMQKNTNYTDTSVMRAAFAWQPVNGLMITPSVFYQNRQVNNDDEYWVGLSNPNSGRYITATPEHMGNHDRFLLPALKIDWDLGDFLGGAELISNTSYFDRKQLVQDYSGTLYNLSYFQQSVDYGVLPVDYVSPCTGGLCAPIAAKIAKHPNYVGPPLLGPASINLPGFPFYKSQNIVTNTQQNITEEARLQSTDPSARFTWVLGVFYTSQSQLSVEEINDPQLPALTQYLWGDPIANTCLSPDPAAHVAILDVWCEGLLPNGDDYINHTQGHERQLAGFANATYAVTDAIKLQAGLRAAKTHFDFTNFSDGAQNFGPNTGNSGKKDEAPVTPMGGVTLQPTPDDLLYLTVATGYRIGGANPPFPVSACAADLKALHISGVPASYNSDSVMSYEAGAKSRFLGGRMQMNGSIYYLKWDNIQQVNYLPSCGFKYTSNLGKAESEGFDMQGEWLVTDALDVDFSLGYTDARYVTTSTVGPTAVLARKGDRLPGSPWTFSLGAQYNMSVMGKDAYLRADYEFASRETGMTPALDPVASSYDPGLVGEPETNEVSLRAGTTLDNFDVALFVDNLLDAHPTLDLSHQDSSTLLYEATTLRPRTVGVTAIYRY